MRITQEETEKRKKKILNTAFSLFCQSGICSVTLTDISRECKIGEATIYRYFGNKLTLVYETMRILWHNLAVKLEESTHTNIDYDNMSGFEQMCVWLEGCRVLYLENSDYLLFSYEAKLFFVRNKLKIHEDFLDGVMEPIRRGMVGAISKGKADGSIHVAIDDLDIFYAVWGAVRGYIIKIALYDELCADENPWRSRYGYMIASIECALKTGF